MKKWIIPYLIMCTIVTLVYLNHFNNEFHFDDSHTIQNNVYITSIKNIPQFFKDGTTFSSLPSNQSYRPLVSTTLAIDYYLGEGLNPFYFHLSMFILFLLQGFLMLLFFHNFFEFFANKNASLLLSVLITAWYMLHPAIAETINYIIARSDSISTLFLILAFVMYQYSSPIAKKYYLYLIPIFIGALAKPPAVMFAPLLFIYINLTEGNFSFKSLIESFKKSLPAFILCAIIYLFIQKMEPETWTPGGSSRFHYIITQPYVILLYTITLILPFWLSADTDLYIFDSISDPRFFIGLLFIILLGWIIYRTYKTEKFKPIAFGLCWYLITLIPTSSVIPLAEVMNDHRIFLPYIGLVISVGWSLYLLIDKLYEKIKNKKQFTDIITYSTIFILSCYAFGTVQRNKVWKTEESLWRDVTIKSPKNPRGLMNYGLTLMGKGDYSGAEKYYLRGLEMWPQYSNLHINMGVVKESTGQLSKAEEYYKNAVNYNPNSPVTNTFLGKFLFKQKRYDEAIPYLKRAIELMSAQIDARMNLMNIYYEKKEFETLKLLAEETLKIVPDSKDVLMYLNAAVGKKSKLESLEEIVKSKPSADSFLELSLKYYEAQQYEKSISASDSALKYNPKLAEAYNNKCASYNELKQWEKAMDACKKALGLKPDMTIAKNNLNWAKSEFEKNK